MASNTSLQDALMRVPEVTLVFWIIKTLSTTVGETGADYLAFDLGLGMPIVTVGMLGVMCVLLFKQFFHYKRYVPANYWTLVVLMSVVGTLITDMLVDLAGISLMSLTIVFTLAMLAGFYVWYRNEGTLSIHSIDTGRREAYYWLVILLAFTLGTGVGDLISEYLILGYSNALLLFSGMIFTVAIAHYVFKLNAVAAFWLAYVLTRPLGASLGDFLIQAPTDGGLGINGLTVNMVFLVGILALVIHSTTQLKQPAVANAPYED